MERNARSKRTASEEDLTQEDMALMFADNEYTANATTTVPTAAAGAMSTTPPSTSSSSNTESSTLPDLATTTSSASATGAASVAAAPSGAARRAPRAAPTRAPPALPATAAQVTDLASLSSLVTALSKAIVRAVQDGKSVTAPNKRLIILAAEETRRAMAAFERTTALATSATPAQPAAAGAAPPAPPAVSSLGRELAACVREEFVKLKAELSQDARRAAARASSGPSYAQAARQHSQPQQHRHQTTAAPFNEPPAPPASRPAIVVSTKAQVTSRQQAVEAFRRSISFRASDYAPARVQPVSRNKLRVEFDTARQRDDALLRLGDASEVTAERARALKPMLLLKGISKSTPPDELVDIVRRQNDCTNGELALKFERKNRHENLYSAVLVASPDVWRKLVDLGRVCVDHQRVHVERFSPFIQCFSCLQFGHVRRNCVPSALKPCACCASAAHQEPDCPSRDDKNSYRCYNCSNRNAKFGNSDPTNHKATSGSCSVARAMRARVESRVDYGAR